MVHPTTSDAEDESEIALLTAGPPDKKGNYLQQKHIASGMSADSAASENSSVCRDPTPPPPPSTPAPAYCWSAPATPADGVRQWCPFWQDVKMGLTDEEADQRRQVFGSNSLAEKNRSPCWAYLRNYWGIMPCMIWIASLIYLIRSLVDINGTAWVDFGFTLLLQVVNGNVKWYNQQTATAAIEALKSQLAPTAIVKRNGGWITLDAHMLVPGDVIQVNLGSIVPADCRLGQGDPLEADQSSLTGESLPVKKTENGILYLSSVIKRGEGEAVVIGTGARTEMGKAAHMVASVSKKSRYDRVLHQVLLYLFGLSCVLMSLLGLVMGLRGVHVLSILAILVTILIGALPIAMHVVCMTVMAIGGYRLSKAKAVVAELTATEELSGMSILCTDKTGTLTYNRLEIMDDECLVVPPCASREDLFLTAYLASKWSDQGQDAIDSVVSQKCRQYGLDKLKDTYKLEAFHPFDPSNRRVEAQVSKNGQIFSVCKGAPQIICSLCDVGEAHQKTISLLARRGFRALGVARNTGDGWVFLGLLAIADPPRKDTAMVVQQAKDLGIKVVMITGDQTAIAKEVGRQIGTGSRILPAKLIEAYLNDTLDAKTRALLPELILNSDGFAEVLPEHKFAIVDILQASGHIVGMTGDGVNDAPALRKANVGIAVSGATDAARASAAIFLQEEGLSVIIEAIYRSKKVYERIKSYIIYRSSTSIRLMGFFFLATLFFNPAGFVPTPEFSGVEPASWCSQFYQADYPFLTPLNLVESEYTQGCTTNFEKLMENSGEPTWDDLCTAFLPGSLHEFEGYSFEDHCFPILGTQPFFDTYCSGDSTCANSLRSSATHARNFYESPTQVILVLTILNDFTVITIAFDHVRVSNQPNQWRVRENMLVGTSLGLVTLLFISLIFYAFLTSMDPTGWMCTRLSVCLTYPQILTANFLLLSLSGRIERTNARTRLGFQTLGLHRSVVLTMTFSIVMAIVLSFVWPFCWSDGICNPHMQPMSGISIVLVVLLQVPIHFLRDLLKLGVYQLLDLYGSSCHELPSRLREEAAECCQNLWSQGIQVDPEIFEPTPPAIQESKEILDDDLKTPCLPGFSLWWGPKLFTGGARFWQNPRAGCNPLAYMMAFLIFSGVGFVVLGATHKI